MEAQEEAAASVLALDLHKLGKQLVRGGQRLRIRLEAALSSDHANEFLADVDVRLFERAGADAAAIGGGRRTKGGRTRGRLFRVQCGSHASQLVRRLEVGDDQLSEGAGLPVGETAGDRAVLPDSDAAQAARRRTCLRDEADG